MLSYPQHKRDCRWKQNERRAQIAALPKAYFVPLTPYDLTVHRLTIPEIVSRIHDGSLTRSDVLSAYGKKTLQAQEATNCLAEIMIGDADTERSGKARTGPLAGVPISIKDSETISGYDATLSFSAWVNKPSPRDSTIVRILRDAGAIIHVKTTVPTTLLSAETRSDVFGRTTNPYNSKYASGGSTGGGASLVCYGGSKIEIGTDLAGSLRTPAHYVGIYTVKGTAGRFPAPGGVSSINGLEAVQLVAGPMARSLDDLENFWERIIQMKPWEYDNTCVPLPWRKVLLPDKVRWGIMWDDGIVPPSPACKRALQMVVDALRGEGHEVVDFDAPNPYEALSIGSQLIFADGGKQLTSAVRWGERLDPGVRDVKRTLGYPRFVKRIYAWIVRYIYRDPLWADLIANFSEKSIGEQWDLVTRRDKYRTLWHDAWTDAGIDFLLTVPNANPAIPKDGMGSVSVATASYVFLFNVLDYTAGVLPVTFVDAVLDTVPLRFKQTVYPKMNTVSKGHYDVYDPSDAHGLPVGVQIAGRRFEEEKVIEGMKAIESALKKSGTEFVPKSF